jgi:hypothetical protein
MGAAAAVCLAAAGVYGYYGQESPLLYSCGFTFYCWRCWMHHRRAPRGRGYT